jgi:hypothetical protein
MQGATIIERAFQLAPECGSLEEVKRKLMREGYSQVPAHLSGKQIRSELLALLDPRLKPAGRASEGRSAPE